MFSGVTERKWLLWEILQQFDLRTGMSPSCWVCSRKHLRNRLDCLWLSPGTVQWKNLPLLESLSCRWTSFSPCYSEGKPSPLGFSQVISWRWNWDDHINNRAFKGCSPVFLSLMKWNTTWETKPAEANIKKTKTKRKQLNVRKNININRRTKRTNKKNIKI